MNSQTPIPSNPLAGLYIHIPFCIKKCGYCDFYSIIDLSLKKRFLNAVCNEMMLQTTDPFIFDTLYLGGGTPSLLDPVEIDALIDAVKHRFRIAEDSEISLEVNPGTVTADRLRDFQKMGVNRLNIGVQSFQPDRLSFLERVHSGKDAESALKDARRAGFNNIGIDLIYGMPNQSESSVLFDLKKAVSFKPEHIACYLLTYESGTPLTCAVEAGQISPLSDERTGDLFETVILFLTDHGYKQYEISNFARSLDLISRHNSKYWNFTPYLGLGPSAHSFMPPKRYWNFADISKYLNTVETGNPPEEGHEILTAQQQTIEAIYLGLRQTKGIDIRGFNRTHGIDFQSVFKPALETLLEDGLIESDTRCCRLTRKGMRFVDSVARMLIDTGFF